MSSVLSGTGGLDTLKTENNSSHFGLDLGSIGIRPSVPITSTPNNPLPLQKSPTQEIELDQTTGGICLYLGARGLNITWGYDGRYWDWGKVRQGSRFQDVAYLKNVCWLEVSGRVQPVLPPGTYTLSWRLSYESQGDIDPLTFSLEATGNEAANNQCRLSASGARTSTHHSDGQRGITSSIWDQYLWMEVAVGEFSVASEDSPIEVKFSMRETQTGNWKSGLYIDGVVIRPFVPIPSIPCNPSTPCTLNLPSEKAHEDDRLQEIGGDKVAESFCVWARGLDVTWGNDGRYWDWGHLGQGSTSREIAYLKNVCWLEVKGRLQFPLSPGTYTLSWRLYYRSENYLDPLKFSLEVTGNEPINTQCRLTASGVMTSRHKSNGQQQSVSWRWDPFGWIEVDVGEFSVAREDPPVEVKFSMRETQNANWKSGLYLDGIVIRPSVYITSVPRSPIFLDSKPYWLDHVPDGMYIEARGLDVIWGNDGRYWDWGHVQQGPRSRDVAYLKMVCWLEAAGRLNFPFAPGTYTLSWRLCYRSKACIEPLRFSLEVTGNEPVKTQCRLTARGARTSRYHSDEWKQLISCRWDPFGWMEVNAGEFSVTRENSQVEVKFSMRETQTNSWKSGLYLDGIVIRPSVPIVSVQVDPSMPSLTPQSHDRLPSIVTPGSGS